MQKINRQTIHLILSPEQLHTKIQQENHSQKSLLGSVRVSFGRGDPKDILRISNKKKPVEPFFHLLSVSRVASTRMTSPSAAWTTYGEGLQHSTTWENPFKRRRAWSETSISYRLYTPAKPTWQWKMNLKMYLISHQKKKSYGFSIAMLVHWRVLVLVADYLKIHTFVVLKTW